MTTPRGLYDLLLTGSHLEEVDRLAPDLADLHDLAPGEAAERMVEVLSAQVRLLLDGMTLHGGVPEQLALVNALLAYVRDQYRPGPDMLDLVSDPPRVLKAIHNAAVAPPIHPDTGLAAPWLFTAGKGSPSLLAELRREAAACDQIDILVSFITISGVRKLIDVLRAITAAGASGAGRTYIRVLTTTYTGATEIAALDELARLNGCEVKVSLDGRRTRLHAKAWIFHRATGFGSAYVGSANLSGAALLGGLEWTTKFTERGQEALYTRAKAHFDTLWLDEEFSAYIPDNAESRAALRAALAREKGGAHDGVLPLSFFDIQPKPYQQEMLDQLAQERERGRHRNLLVAATGTGKTVVAALDYRRICEIRGDRPRLLFVAHRAQILRQALRTYREVLRDHSFGELLTGGLTPDSYDYLFASIDSVTSRDLVAHLGADHWHTVVIDECHRLAADRFDRLATSVQPKQLLGLTATPERSDGQPISAYFTPRPDGSPAVELRLWDALEMQLLSPFEYYGCDDSTDFADVPWNSPGEVAAVDRLVTGNDVRARLIVSEWSRLAADPRKARAIVFCVSVAHAEFMTQRLNDAGIPAACVVGSTPKVDQVRAPKRLKDGEISAIVTVDLYNEGVDLPDVDTLLLLRPTQSPVLFQQQIGRGLRLSPGKESCLVLDFVGQHRKDFRFDRLLGGLTGLTRRGLIDSLENGFSVLPPGCHVHLEKQTRDQVLRSLRAVTQQTWRRLTSELQGYAALRRNKPVGLGEFLHEQHLTLDEIYRESAPSGWTTLKRGAGLLPGEAGEGEAKLSRRLGDLLHLDDSEHLGVLRRVAEGVGTYKPSDERDRTHLQMLAYQLDTSGAALPYTEVLNRFRNNAACAIELGELADVLIARSRLDLQPLPGAAKVPLQLHGAYRIREILAAFRYHTAESRTPFQAGVLALQDWMTELLFVTLDKSEGFHDRIAYHDFAVSPKRFHWQTQNSAGPHTRTGRRYLESANNGWQYQLFVRGRVDEPYRACGPVTLQSTDDISGDRPMSINWTLEVPLPPQLFAEFSVLRGQA